MIRRSIGTSDTWLSVIGVQAGGILAATEPQTVLDACAWAGVDWIAVGQDLDPAPLVPLLAACPRPPRCLLAAQDVADLLRRRSCFPDGVVWGGCLPAAPPARLDLPLVCAASDPAAADLLLVDYDLLRDAPREGGLLDACHEAGTGAISRDPWHGLHQCPDGIDRQQWQLAMARLDELAQEEETDRFGLAIGVLQATPGMTACLVDVHDSAAAAALSAYGLPAKSRSIKRTLSTIAAMRDGALRVD
ncbi:MAG: hypothetical protein ACOCXA_01605 [Planctomycetota bacterium]